MKRRVVIIAVFLLAGAIVNVAVAWGCVTHAWPRPPMIPWNVYGGSMGGWEHATEDDVHRLRSAGWMPVTGPRGNEIRLPTQVLTFVDAAAGVDQRTTAEVRVIPDYMSVIGIVEPIDTTAILALRTGWPLGALGHVAISRQTLLSPARRWNFGASFEVAKRHFPLSFLWPGFAINTLVYATLLWLLILGPFVMRRYLRIRRGRCPKCAYPMGTTEICTECGAVLHRLANAAD